MATFVNLYYVAEEQKIVQRKKMYYSIRNHDSIIVNTKIFLLKIHYKKSIWFKLDSDMHS